VQIFSVFFMISNGFVSTCKGHITNLPLTCIVKNILAFPAIRIAMFFATLRRKKKDHVMI